MCNNERQKKKIRLKQKQVKISDKEGEDMRKGMKRGSEVRLHFIIQYYWSVHRPQGAKTCSGNSRHSGAQCFQI